MARRLLILFSVLGAVVLAASGLSWLLPPVPAPLQITETKTLAAIPVASRWHQVSAVPWAARDSHTVYSFQGKLYLLGGLSVDSGGQAVTMAEYAKGQYYNDIWVSSDGSSWQEATSSAAFPPLRSASVVEHDGALYLLGGWSPTIGYKIGIWKSIDGVTWEQVASTAPFGAREGQRVVEWNGRLYLLGGVNYETAELFNDTWVSSDGLNWQKETALNPLRPDNPWAPRWDHDVVVFQNKLWLAGGMAFGGRGYGDVWSSADGHNWQLVAEATPWGKRQGHILDVFQERLWLIGGLGIETNAVNGGTWTSADGQVWQPLAAASSGETWAAREDHSAIVFQNKLWLLGGMDENWRWTNDLWYLE